MIKNRITIFLAFVAINVGVVNAGNKLDYAANFAVMQSSKVKKAQKKQDKKAQAEKKAIRENSKTTQKRSYKIQSSDVQKRMKQNQKEIDEREKARKKSNKSKTKRGAKKYK